MRLLNPHLPPATIKARKLGAVVFDWAGTTVDFGSVAPARTLVSLFLGKRLHLEESEIRRDMGIPKKDHIAAILAMPRVRALWAGLYGAEPGQADVDALYADFLPLQMSCLAQYSSVIPGVPQTVEACRARGLKIGSTTGYTRAMLDVLLESAAREGYAPDCHFTPSEVGSGRPEPFMLYACAIRLRVYPPAALAKVGDTPADILEGLHAGSWSIGVAGTGNGIGCTQAEFAALPAPQRAARLASSRTELENAGAHFVIDTLEELLPVLEQINALLQSL